MNKTILVARGVLPDAFPPSYAVALAVAKLVNLPPAAVGPLSVLLATKPVSGLFSIFFFLLSPSPAWLFVWSICSVGFFFSLAREIYSLCRRAAVCLSR